MLTDTNPRILFVFLKRTLGLRTTSNPFRFTEYDDTVERRLVECIKVSPDRTIEIILKGGIHGKEKV